MSERLLFYRDCIYWKKGRYAFGTELRNTCNYAHTTFFHSSHLPFCRAIMKPQAVEFLVHMSLATAAAAVNSLAEEVMVDEMPRLQLDASVSQHDPRYSVSFEGEIV